MSQGRGLELFYWESGYCVGHSMGLGVFVQDVTRITVLFHCVGS